MKNMLNIAMGGDSIVIAEDNHALKKDLADSFTDLLNDLTEDDKNAPDATPSLQSLVTQANTNFRNGGTMIIQLPDEQLKPCVLQKCITITPFVFTSLMSLDFLPAARSGM